MRVFTVVVGVVSSTSYAVVVLFCTFLLLLLFDHAAFLLTVRRRIEASVHSMTEDERKYRKDKDIHTLGTDEGGLCDGSRRFITRKTKSNEITWRRESISRTTIVRPIMATSSVRMLFVVQNEQKKKTPQQTEKSRTKIQHLDSIRMEIGENTKLFCH